MGPERCTCPKAQKYWEHYDAEQERIEREKKEAEERERMQERIRKLLGDSGIKKRFVNRTFETFEVTSVNREAFLTAKQYAEDFRTYSETGEGIFFTGSYGTGKTHLAVAISLYLINKGIPVICKTLIDLLAEIKKTFDDDGGVKEYDILNLYKKVDLLVIDDLGKEPPTDWTLATFYAIINERYENCKPVVITTNYNDDELIRRLSKHGDEKTAGAIVSRLHEMCFTVEMNWQDKRSGT
jgi:DNA replication protein DnaC